MTSHYTHDHCSHVNQYRKKAEKCTLAIQVEYMHIT